VVIAVKRQSHDGECPLAEFLVARISINDLQEKSLGAAEVRSLIALGKLHKDVGRDRWSSAGRALLI
jgi:hypothetical protein